MIKRIESAQNSRVKQWKKLHTKKEREKTGLFLIEGRHLVEEALKYKTVVKEIIVREGEEFSAINIGEANVTEVTKEVMKLLTDTETPQGIIAVCEMPKPCKIELSSSPLRLLLIDNVQDPGNLGTMIRTSDAAGIDAVILGDGCVDLYNGKTIRSTQGSLFHIPIIKGNLTTWIDELTRENIKVFGTALDNARDYKEVPSQQQRFALLVGNEGNGVNRELLKMTDENIYIPIFGEAESLNVSIATGILLYHLRG